MIINGDAKMIAAAFVKACGEMNATVAKDAKGNFGKYATLAAIVEATTGALGRNGLAVIQEAHVNETGVCVDTWMIHESGATMHFEPLTMPLADRKPQAVGSAITYARRYQLAAICGLAPDDDDGQAAQDAKAPRRPAAAPTEDVSFDRQHDNPFDDAPPMFRLTPEQAAIIAHLGKSAYPDDWDDNMDRLALWASGGARGKLGDLYEIEAEKLIKALKKKAQAVAA